MPKTLLITGASSGIGKATARHFQAKGWNVIATMSKPEQEAELNQLPGVLVTRLDVQDTDSIAKAVEAGIARLGRIDVLVNNAGYGAYGPLEVTPLARIRNQFDVNVLWSNFSGHLNRWKIHPLRNIKCQGNARILTPASNWKSCA
jgi:NAD(P)-dependent dehydrogenase (short-subunit alcohol dehydrogenase family)